jgi:hypothetical protein
MGKNNFVKSLSGAAVSQVILLFLKYAYQQKDLAFSTFIFD